MDGQAIEAYQQAGLRPADGVWEEKPGKVWYKKGSRAMPMRVRTGDLVQYQGTEGEGEGYIVGFLLDCPEVAIISDGPGQAVPVNVHRITFNSGSFLAHAYALRCEHERRATEWPLQPLIKEVPCEQSSRS